MTRLKKLFAVLALNALVISFFSCKNNDEGPTYTISYEDGRTVISSQEIPINETVTVKSQSELGYPMKDTEMITGWMYCPYNEMSSVGSTGDVREPGSTFKATTNVRLCAKWGTRYYKVTFKANGGWFSSVSSDTYTQDRKYTYSDSISLQTPYRAGYTLLGWSRDESATKIDFYPSAKPKIADVGDITLYAVWGEKKDTITFNANGGTIATSTQILPDSISTALEKADALKLSRYGYIFKGWAKSKDATSVEFTDGQNITPTENMTLYAVWAYTPTYTITFDANGGGITTTTQSVTGETIDGSLPVTLKTANELGINRTGYTFKGWAKSNSATKLGFEDGSSITITEDTTLYAVWSYIATYTVTFKPNGGTLSTTTQKISGETITGLLTETLRTGTSLGAERSGYKLKGWSTNEEGSGTTYTDGKSITISEDLILYAIWDKIITYTVTYNANGGSISRKTQTVEGTISEGITFNLFKADALGLSRSGYLFNGWSESSDSTYVRFSDGEAVHAELSGSKTLYAVWVLPTYWITYHKTDDYGVTAGSTARNSVTGTTTIILPTASSLGLNRSGYTFLGWKTERTSNTYYKVGSNFTVSESLTLYGVWQKNCIYVHLYHPGYTDSKTKFSTMTASIGGYTTENYPVSWRSTSYSTGVKEFSIPSSGEYAWSTVVRVQKTGYKEQLLTKSGTYNFVLGGTYKINVVTGAVTRTK